MEMRVDRAWKFTTLKALVVNVKCAGSLFNVHGSKESFLGKLTGLSSDDVKHRYPELNVTRYIDQDFSSRSIVDLTGGCATGPK